MCCAGQALDLLIIRATVIDMSILLVRSAPVVQRPHAWGWSEDSPSARPVVVQPAYSVGDDE